MLLLGLIAFTVYTVVALEKVERLERKTVNRVLILSAVGIAALYFSAAFFDSLFHSIANGRLTLGGITWLGGVIAAFPVMILLLHFFCPACKGNELYVFGLTVPGIALAHGFGRIGCFLGGCCYGKPTDSIFGVVFPKGSLAANQYPTASGASLPVLPTQLFEAIFELLLFSAMLIFYKKLKRHFAATYCVSYGVFRFIIEFFRGDSRGSTGFFLTPSQLISLILIALGVLAILFTKGTVFKKLAEKCEKWQLDASQEPKKQDKNTSLDLVRELHSLYTDGIITKEEFEQKKKDILSRL